MLRSNILALALGLTLVGVGLRADEARNEAKPDTPASQPARPAGEIPQVPPTEQPGISVTPPGREQPVTAPTTPTPSVPLTPTDTPRAQDQNAPNAEQTPPAVPNAEQAPPAAPNAESPQPNAPAEQPAPPANLEQPQPAAPDQPQPAQPAPAVPQQPNQPQQPDQPQQPNQPQPAQPVPPDQSAPVVPQPDQPAQPETQPPAQPAPEQPAPATPAPEAAAEIDTQGLPITLNPLQEFVSHQAHEVGMLSDQMDVLKAANRQDAVMAFYHMIRDHTLVSDAAQNVLARRREIARPFPVRMDEPMAQTPEEIIRQQAQHHEQELANLRQMMANANTPEERSILQRAEAATSKHLNWLRSMDQGQPVQIGYFTPTVPLSRIAGYRQQSNVQQANRRGSQTNARRAQRSNRQWRHRR